MIKLNLWSAPGACRAGLWLAFLTAWLAGPGAQAANPGDEVVVVYNKRMPGSKSVADHYAERRQVPANQVFGVDASTEETVSRPIYQREVHEVLARAFEKKGFWKLGDIRLPATNGHPARVVRGVVESKVRYLVLCCGMPLHIAEDTNIVESGTEKLRPELCRSEAAVDSELALLPWPQQLVHYFGPVANMFYTTTNAAAIRPTNGLLMVTRLDGPTVEIARSLVDKAMQAEADGLWGRAYFDLRGIRDGGYALGDKWIGTAAEVAALGGFETIVDTNAAVFPVAFPMSQIALYVGWYTERVSGPLALNVVEFMPGAFAYHLHSYSAHTLRSKVAAWTGPLLAKGATATMGSVAEPYLAGTPDVGTFMSRWILSGFTFGEAAYACQGSLSWMTTVVGDPLYRPFGRDLRAQHEDLIGRKSKHLEWSYLRLVNLNLNRGFSLAQGAEFLDRLPETKHSSVLLEKLGDLYLAQGKPSSTVFTWQQALQQLPTLQQRVRIQLKLAPELASLGQDKDALQVYRQFLEDYPDYQDRLTVLQAMQPLAQKLDPRLAEKYQKEIDRLAPAPVTVGPATTNRTPSGP